jgi:hypothetical protein
MYIYDNILPILLRMRNVSDKFAEKIKTHILRSNTFFPENRAVYEVMWKNMVEPDRPQMTI